MTAPVAEGRIVSPRKLAALTAASSLGIAVPGYIHHGIAAIGPFIIDAFSLSKASFGLFISAFALVGAVTSPALGHLADRVGGVRLLRWAFWLAIGVSVGIAVAPGFAVLIIVAALAGLTASAANPATNTLIGQHMPGERRGFTVGIKQAGGPLGIALAGLAMPPIASAWGWEWAVLSGVALPAIGLGLIRWSGVRPAGRKDAPVARSARPPLGRRISLLTVNATAIGIGLGAVLGFVAVYGVEEVGMSETAAGAMLTVIGVVGVAGRLGWGALADRVQSTGGLLAAIGALSLLGTAGMWLAADLGPAMLIAGAAVFGASAMAWNAIGMLAVIREAAAERAGAASGIVIFGFLGGLTFGPWAFGALIDLSNGYSASFLMVAAAFAVSIAVLVVPQPSEVKP